MTISQKRAIYYNYKAKRDASIDNFLHDNDLMHEFLESKYASKVWFIKSLIKSYEADRKWINVDNICKDAIKALAGKCASGNPQRALYMAYKIPVYGRFIRYIWS